MIRPNGSDLMVINRDGRGGLTGLFVQILLGLSV